MSPRPPHTPTAPDHTAGAKPANAPASATSAASRPNAVTRAAIEEARGMHAARKRGLRTVRFEEL